MKYQLQYPRWMKYPTIYLNEFLGVPLDKMTVSGKLLIVDWDLDIEKCSEAGFMIEEFDEQQIVINVTGSLCQIVTPIDEFLAQELDQICSYEVPGKDFFTNTKWDGVVHLYRVRTRKFPVGLLHIVKKSITRYLKERGEVVVTDERPEPESIPMPESIKGIELRDYQLEAVNTGIEQSVGLINACVGAGKTEIACELIRRIGTKTVFLVHRKELLYQAKDRLEKRLGMKIGQVGDGKVDIRPVSIMMFQALSRYIEDDKHLMVKETKSIKLEEDNTEIKNIKDILAGFSCVVVDECAHVPARTFYKVLTAFDNCRFRYGLSASPDREDGQDMAIFAGVGSIVHKISASELIKRNFLVPPTIIMLKLDRKIYHGRPGYMTVYKDYITDNTDRNGKLVEETYKMIKEGRKVLVLVDRINHGKIFNKMLVEYCGNLDNPLDIRVETVKGALSTKVRNKIMSEFKKGDIDCVIATSSLYQEGVDIPICNGLVIAGGGKSRTKTRQMVGRAIRIHPESGKIDAKVIDCYDQALYLTSHAKQRLETYREEKEFEVIVQ